MITTMTKLHSSLVLLRKHGRVFGDLQCRKQTLRGFSHLLYARLIKV